MRTTGRTLLAGLVGLTGLLLAVVLSACTEQSDPVTLTESSITWERYAYELTDFNTILGGSFDGETIVEETFPTWVLENEHLRVTLLPEYGGRIISLVNKATGHEQLYQNPVGVPYQINTNVFYYNHLIVYGGIFPTFPEPEHGRTWLLPWDFEVIEETDDRVTVAMSYTDDSEFPFAPPNYDVGVTGLTVTYNVSLARGRNAVDAEVVIENPADEPVRYEYWTNTTLAPGSEPGETRTTADAEIIAPVDLLRIPPAWSSIAAQEEPTGLIDVYEFDALRRFGNWSDLGIAYAFPDAADGNFWGVINQGNGEGIFRIADNSVTPGLKLWTWGHAQSADVDPRATTDEARPYIELWAGLTREFFQRTEIAADSELRFDEVYSPTVGLRSVTHASRDFLVDLAVGADGRVTCEVFGLHPGREVTATVTDADGVMDESVLVLEAAGAGTCAPDGEAQGEVTLTLRDDAGATLFTAAASR